MPPHPTWVSQLVGHVSEGGNLLFLGGVHHHHRGSKDAQQTADFSMDVKPLVQKVGGEHGTGRGETSDECGEVLKKAVSDKVFYFSIKNKT